MKLTMGQALYRKYRSKSLSEVVGQEHVTTTLTNALKNGRISHAYLLSGPRGVGKTSIARILAHEINGLPYDDEVHLDIIEIDAASNRRIDEIRDLRDRVNTAPASAKYKVYIIDEVHMLTKEAFNALLKTLEEPPAHVVFILATTEAHKLPETIISRTQRYSLHPIPEDLVVEHLQEIAKSEKLKIDDGALQLIARHGDGSFRDSISLLDQASSINESITKSDVERVLGLAPDEHIAKLAAATTEGDKSAVVTILSGLYAQGFEPAMISQQLSASIRDGVLTGQSTDPGSDLHLLKNLLDVSAARNPRQLLEIVLLQSTSPASTKSVQKNETSKVAKPAAHTEKTIAPVKTPVVAKEVKAPVEEKTEIPEEPVEQAVEAPAETSATVAIEDVSELWEQTLESIKKQYNTLYGIARMAQPTFDGQKLTLTFKFTFHQKRISEAKNRKILSDIVEKLYGQPVEIACAVGDGESKSKPDVSAISNIFGGAELLES